jgi:hypothetical protein
MLNRLGCLPATVVAGLLPYAVLAAEPTATVRFRLVDVEAGRTTPAMVCITGTSDGAVRVPPHGSVATQPSRTDRFIKGVKFSPDPNWIGPIRKTMGKGDNDDRAWVYEVRPSIPYWKEPVMYQTSGDFTIELPAGRWRIGVEHGLEYVPVVEEFSLRGDEKGLVRTIELRRWIDLPKRGWWSGDVHVHHPILEDAQREFLLHYAVAEDLHIVNVLEMGDHQTTWFRQMGFGKAYRARSGDYCLVAGQEEPRSTFGHIIGLNIDGLARDVGNYDFYDLAFRRLHEQPGAVVGFAHFAWNGCSLPRGFPWYVTTGGIDFIEVLQFSQLNAMDYYDYLNLGLRLTAAAGSDVPWGSTIGEVRTHVHVGPTLDIDGWYRGLKAGNTFVSNGPVLEFTVNGKLPGTEIACPAKGTVKVAARVWGHPKIGVPARLTVVGNDGVVREIANPDRATELALEFDYPVEGSGWLVAGTVCDNSAVAHSTPVYLVVNGKPTWSATRGPAVIRKQLEAIARIEQEFAKGTDGRSAGVRERLERARAYYGDLLRRMRE